MRTISSIIVAVVAMLVIVGGAFSISLMAHATVSARVPMSGQTVPLLKQAQFVSAASGQQQLDLSIGLKLRNTQQLDMLLSEMYNPKSALYHHFLTPQQFVAEFGPIAAQQQQVVSYLQSQGITVTHVASNGLLINARASISTVETAFGVKINNYQIGPRKFYANANAPTLPAELSSLILSIGGLDNSVHLRPLNSLATHTTSRRSSQHAQPLAGYAPPDLNGAYDATPLHQGNIQGNNQTVAVFELDGFQQSDIDQYLKNNNLGTLNLSTQLVDGATLTAGQGTIEVELDIEVVAAMAPKASQIV